MCIYGIKKQSSSNLKKDDIITQLKNQLKLAEGQIRAGNNNPLVKKEIKDIMQKLDSYNVVSLKNSKEYFKQFSIYNKLFSIHYYVYKCTQKSEFRNYPKLKNQNYAMGTLCE